METHILFFIIAGALIFILIGASIWSARREKSRVFSNTFSTRPAARPINTSIQTDNPPPFAAAASPLSMQATAEAKPKPLTQPAEESLSIQQQEIERSVKEIKISLADASYSSSESRATVQAQSASTLTEQPHRTPFYHEPASHIATQQPSANNQTVHATVASVSRDVPEPEAPVEPVTAEKPPRILSLYVVAAEGKRFRGDLVVQQLEALGLQFGEYHIFHRHLDNASSPVLFSAANVMQPGVFDLNNLERFFTVGLIFFMQLPSVGNDLANLKLMIRTVESFAQSMGGFVLDETHQLFDDAARQAYLLRVAQP